MQMRLFDRQSRKRERTLTLLAMEGVKGGLPRAATAPRVMPSATAC